MVLLLHKIVKITLETLWYMGTNLLYFKSFCRSKNYLPVPSLQENI